MCFLFSLFGSQMVKPLKRLIHQLSFDKLICQYCSLFCDIESIYLKWDFSVCSPISMGFVFNFWDHVAKSREKKKVKGKVLL